MLKIYYSLIHLVTMILKDIIQKITKQWHAISYYMISYARVNFMKHWIVHTRTSMDKFFIYI